MDKVAEELLKLAKLLVSRDWVISPDALISAALRGDYITHKEALSRKIRDAAREVAEGIRDDWGEGQGFGSSDRNYAVREMLENAGIKVYGKNGRLSKEMTAKGIGPIGGFQREGKKISRIIDDLEKQLDEVLTQIDYHAGDVSVSQLKELRKAENSVQGIQSGIRAMRDNAQKAVGSLERADKMSQS